MELDELKWTNAAQLPHLGQGWTDTENPYDRFPARAKGVIRDEVWKLSRCPSGVRLRFVTDSTVIAADWTLPEDEPVGGDHMPATGKSGLDLYIKLDTGWHWAGISRIDGPGRNRKILLPDMTIPGPHEYILYLPLYNRLEALSIGIAPEATFAPAEPDTPGFICFYGTSITQGGCASRPGMAYPAILGRWLERPFINLGFSGNARMEPEIADLLAELDPALFVLDTLPNVPTAEVEQRAEPFIRKLRDARPTTPIVIVENVIYQNVAFVRSRKEEVEARNRQIRNVYQRLTDDGLTGLTYVPADDLLGHDGEATVDGTHFTDLGFLRMADALEPVLKPLL